MRTPVCPALFAGVLLAAPTSAQSLWLRIDKPVADPTGRFGQEVAGAGDVDGDGHADVVVGSTSFVYVFSGLDGAQLHRVDGSSGWGVQRVAGGGDVDADGHDDFMAVDASRPNARVYSGLTGLALHVKSLPGLTAVALAGDVDADGHEDFAISVVAEDRIRIYSGDTGSLLRTIDGAGGGELENAGDLDGGGVDDLLTLREEGGTTLGVRAYSGENGSLINHVLLRGPVTCDFTMGGAGDVDADGNGDYVVGNHDDRYVRVYSGADDHLLWELTPPGDGDVFGFGWGVCSAGDVDLDGHADFAYRDGNDGVRVNSGASGEELYFYPDATGGFHWDLAFVGDANGDGFPEIVSGNELESGSPPPGFGDGWCSVISPCPLPPQRYCAGLPSSAGRGASMTWSGTPSRAAGDFAIGVEGAVPGELGLFCYGAARVELPFGDGLLCVGGGGLPIFRLHPPILVGPAGRARRAVPIGAPPGDPAAGDVAVLMLWSFQFWYRDPAGPGGSGFNLSDALAVTFCP